MKLDPKGGLQVAGNPTPAGPSPDALAVNGEHVYAGSRRSSDIAPLARAGTGMLAFSNVFIPTGCTATFGIWVPLTGARLYAVNGVSGDMSQFEIVTGSGMLRPISPMVVPGRGTEKAITLRSFALSASGKFACAMDNGRPPGAQPEVPVRVHAYTVEATGGLAPITAAPQRQPGQPDYQPFVETSTRYGQPWLQVDGLLCRPYQ